MAQISSLGAGTSLDLNSIYDKLQDAENARLTPFTQQQSSYKAQLTAYSIIQTSLDKLRTANKALSAGNLATTAVTSTNTAFSATLAPNAGIGNYNINVTQLAQSQSLITQKQANNKANIGNGAATRTLTISQGKDAQGKDRNISVTLTNDQTNLTGIRDAINAKQAGVTASIIKGDDNSYYLSLTSSDTGTANAMTVSVSGDDTLQGVLGYDPTAATNGLSVSVPAQDAQLTINDLQVTRSSNNITDAIDGVTLNLKATSKDTEKLAINRDATATTTAIQAFVDAYNSLQTTIANQTAYTASKPGSGTQDASNGALVGDNTTRTITSQLRSQLTSSQNNSDYATLSSMGITQDINGKLTVDSAKLADALAKKPASVAAFFQGDGKTTGFSTQTETLLGNILNTSGGLLQNATDGINKTLKSLGDQITQTQASIDANMAATKKQFTQLSVLVNQLTNTGNALASQLNSNNN
ncbi:flagellar filament capping protein FliD [Rouxiella sp. Mn2063]|uniref:flagellar filament capping protein FliD n=1 Tax=Rouxiella sp. Mn2063 TaxID=3395262 RepID=UPI003BE32B83